MDTEDIFVVRILNKPAHNSYDRRDKPLRLIKSTTAKFLFYSASTVSMGGLVPKLSADIEIRYLHPFFSYYNIILFSLLCIHGLMNDIIVARISGRSKMLPLAYVLFINWDEEENCNWKVRWKEDKMLFWENQCQSFLYNVTFCIIFVFSLHCFCYMCFITFYINILYYV